ncbi:hypothetical protein BDY21DRAFT_335919 [Lineolata rhizophorae]|uniref:HECT-type E3 ubiquitin transferase n=1 Tax=Lineolata rhizophorae TaxID=578093 RepID=A0A6A6P9P2_9PEZI|nr:hypothetical protein BDY21DRAFT_335919 [Lineolata rhizophorae]
MYQSFTGSSRRPRQVNLSGRTANPFASVGSGHGSQAAVVSAQRERQNRERERARLNAVKTLQRTWRGYQCRRGLQDELRTETDKTELSMTTGGSIWSLDGPAEAYPSETASLEQLQRLVKFIDVRNKGDITRMMGWFRRHCRSEELLDGSCQSGSWQMAYLKLRQVILAALSRRTKVAGSDSELVPLLDMLTFTTIHSPELATRLATSHYAVMASLTRGVFAPTGCTAEQQDSILRAVLAPLQPINSKTPTAYEAFACVFLTVSELTDHPMASAVGLGVRYWLNCMAGQINHRILAKSLSSLLSRPEYGGFQQLRDRRARLRLLGCFVFFHRQMHNFENAHAYSSESDFVAVVSYLLCSVADAVDLDSRAFDEDESDEKRSVRTGIKNEFIQEQVLSLVDQESIKNLLTCARSSQSNGHSFAFGEIPESNEAIQLARYALTLLRVFPRRGDEIRMWLYLGSRSSKEDPTSGRNLPAIKYFWHACRATNIFQSISKDSRAAIKLLKPNQLRTEFNWKAPSTSNAPDSSLGDEWTIILIFMELYTFVLKLVDDNEFFSEESTAASMVGSSGVSWTPSNSLPLLEVRDLTTFLKHLGFAMYFYGVEIIDTGGREAKPSEISIIFHTSSHLRTSREASRSLDSGAKSPANPTVAGVSLEYIKGLVTGLLRMVYERDSRRPFLPDGHWLMTSKFDMDKFIPAVVEEEEKRHQVEEEDEDEEGQDNYSAEATLRYAPKQRRLQSVAPRLEILQNMPFLIPFHTRVQIFREFVTRDMTLRRHGAVDPDHWRAALHQLNPFSHDAVSKHSARIRRNHEFDDAYEQFYTLGEGLKEPIQITFVDQFDNEEAGIDGGGVTKEFLTSVTNEAFVPDKLPRLFVENDQHLLYPNPTALEEKKELLRVSGVEEYQPIWRTSLSDLLQKYEFLGRIVGKCLYEGILVDINFAGFFLRKWALTGGTGSASKESGYRANINDLRDLDEALYQGLLQLKNYPGDVEDFALDFTVTDTVPTHDEQGERQTIAISRDLRTGKPGVNSTPVTNENRLVYISYMARYRLQMQPYQQTSAFLRGLSTLIQPSWLSMFNQSELQTLLSGARSSISVDDLRRNTQYGGVYVIGDDGLEHPTVELFWHVMEGFSDGERRAVLKFVTSTPRAPLLGFGSLNPKFSIRDAGTDQSRLPSTSTCINLLKLPQYRSEEKLKERLLYAAFSGAGFDLS